MYIKYSSLKTHNNIINRYSNDIIQFNNYKVAIILIDAQNIENIQNKNGLCLLKVNFYNTY